VGGPVLVTLHLFGVAATGVPRALGRMAVDRIHLARTPGLRFSKLLGIGDGQTFTVRDSDPRRWGLLAVWDDAAALTAFERTSPTARGWGRLALERWRADLVPLRSKGRWAGQEPFGPVFAAYRDGPVAAITRARLRPRLAPTFWRAVPPVVADLHATPGLRFSIGVGEAPLGLQGTFSVWDDADALGRFAYRGAAHLDVIRRTDKEGWYGEELFARFAVVQTTGTVGGVDPAAARSSADA
jgi:hypothetical protein